MYDSKWWTPLLLALPIGWYLFIDQYQITDLLVWLYVQITGIVLLLCAILAQFSGIKPDWSHREEPTQFRTEQAYLIRTTRDLTCGTGKGYPMIVNAETVEKAMQCVDEYGNPDYIYEGPATSAEAGDHYVNDGTGGSGSYVPAGHIVVEEPHYLDERLNG